MLDSLTKSLEKFLSELTPIEKTILSDRLCTSQAQSLDDIASILGLTQERVRQKQSELEDEIASRIKLAGNDFVPNLVRKLDRIDAYSNVEMHVLQSAPQVGDQMLRLLAHSVIRLAGYTHVGGVIVSKRARDFSHQFRKLARAATDESGLIKREILEASLPDAVFVRHFNWFKQQCGLHELFGLLAFRRTRRAKLIAALRKLGRPATRPELAEMCGLTNKIASAALSSISEIVRISRTQWALKDWSLHEYRGIVEEIVDYIDRAGGIAPVEILIEEISQRFDVKRWSVQAYMQTPKFQIHDKMICIAKQPSATLNPLSAVIHGIDEKDRFFWTFPVLKRYFRGYSVVGVPVEIADYLGCPPDNSTKLEVSNIARCHHLTIQWYLSSTTKASIGFIRDALVRLNLSEGQIVRLTLIKKGVVELDAHTVSVSNAKEE